MSYADIAYYGRMFDSQFPGCNAGQAYANYAAANTDCSPHRSAQAFLVMSRLQGITATVEAWKPGQIVLRDARAVERWANHPLQSLHHPVAVLALAAMVVGFGSAIAMSYIERKYS